MSLEYNLKRVDFLLHSFISQTHLNYILPLILLLLGAAGFAIYKNQGVESRHTNTAANVTIFNGFQVLEGDTGHILFHEYISKNYFQCQPKKIHDKSLIWGQYVRCAQSKDGSEVDIALLGDSHAEHLFIGLANSLPTKNVAFYIRGGPPYLSNPEFQDIYRHLLNSISIKVVIIAMWQGRNGELVPSGSTTADEFSKAIDKLEKKGKKVYLLEDIPQFPFEPERCKSKRVFSSRAPNCEIDFMGVRDFSGPYRGVLEIIVKKNPSVKLIEVQKYFCNSNFCSMVNDNKLLYRNNNHLNINGSIFLGEKVANIIMKDSL